MRASKIDSAVKTVEPLALRVPQAARFLGIGRSKLYEFINAGEIESVKIGGSTVIPVESLKSFLERCRSS